MTTKHVLTPGTLPIRETKIVKISTRFPNKCSFETTCQRQIPTLSGFVGVIQFNDSLFNPNLIHIVHHNANKGKLQF